MKACVFTLGCKVNETESACIMASLEKLGWEVSDRLCQIGRASWRERV